MTEMTEPRADGPTGTQPPQTVPQPSPNRLLTAVDEHAGNDANTEFLRNF